MSHQLLDMGWLDPQSPSPCHLVVAPVIPSVGW